MSTLSGVEKWSASRGRRQEAANLASKLPAFITEPDPAIYYSDNYLVLDFETTSIQYGSAVFPENSMILSVYGKQAKYKEVFGSEYMQDDLVRRIETVDFLVAHNAKFELQWLRRCGLDISNVLVFDTMLAEYVISGNRRLPLDLGTVAKRYGLPGKENFVDRCIKGGVCPSQIPKSLLKRRCVYDVSVTERLFLNQREVLSKSRLLETAQTRFLTTVPLAELEFAGMSLDRARVENEYRRVNERLSEVNQKIQEISGGVNLRSSKQLGELLYGELGFKEPRNRDGTVARTAGGSPRTDINTIRNLVARNNKQRTFKELIGAQARLDALLTKNLEFFYGVCDQYGGIFHGRFNQTATATHRLSSSGVKIKVGRKERGVQFQNMPREYKRLFTARKEGYQICEADGSQLEFRVAAHLGNDRQAIHDISTGEDVHMFTADTITAAGQATDRQTAKAHTFKPLYGGSSGTKAEKAYYEAFKRKYSGIAKTQQSWVYDVLRDKCLTTQTGLKFYWPDTVAQPSGYITNTTSICNYPVQSLATAEIIPIALVYIWHAMKALGMESFIVNTIHDSVIFEVKDDEVELLKDIIVQGFVEYPYFYLKRIYNIDFNAPLGCGIKIGTNWGEGTEEKYEAGEKNAS